MSPPALLATHESSITTSQRPNCRCAADFERRAVERGTHVVGQVVIAGAGTAPAPAMRRRRGGSSDSRPDRPAPDRRSAGCRPGGWQRRCASAIAACNAGRRRHAAQAAGGVTEQVHVGELNEADGLHRCELGSLRNVSYIIAGNLPMLATGRVKKVTSV